MTTIENNGTALITGASSGIGAVYADRLAQRGYDLILVARNRQRLDTVAKRLSDKTGRAIAVVGADLNKHTDLARVEALLRNDASITMLLNNAGVGASAPLLGSNIDQMLDLISLNVGALTRLVYAAVPSFVARGHGTIVNIASIVAIAPELLNGVYGASKAFVLTLSRSLNHELAAKGVRVQAVLPGATATEFWDIAGMPIEHLPADIVMTTDNLVDALVRKATVEVTVRCRGNRSHPQIRRGPLALILGLAAWILGGGFGVAQAQPSSNSFSNPLVRAPDASAKQADAYYQDYRFRDGESLPRLRLHYATLGSPHRNERGDIDNAVLVLHWTASGGSALLTPEYVKALFDPGRPLDARRYYLIFPDNIGHGNSSKPSDGMRASFPHYRYGDLVDLQHKLVTETLGIKHLHAILGMSMGGMNAWQWAEAYPDAMDGVMPVVSLPVKVSGRNLLWRRMVIADIRNDPDWQDGNYATQPRGSVQGYQLLRMMIDGVPHLQAIVLDAKSADGFMDSAAQQVASQDANDQLYSLESSLDYDPEPGLSGITTNLLALNFSDDEFNPDVLQLLQHLMPRVRHGRYVVQKGTPESFGHLTMAHPALWADHVRDFMKTLGEPPPIQGSQ
jgi:homoserine O-acetyltransferase